MKQRTKPEQTNTVTVEERTTSGPNRNGSFAKEDRTMLLERVRESDTSRTRTFTLRPTTMDDLESAVELFNTCSVHMMGKKEVNVSDVRSEWLLPEFALETATRVAVDDQGQLVGYVEVWDISELPVNIWVWARVHPDHEGEGIGTALMDWAESRARQALRRVPEDIKVVMRSGTVSGYEPAAAFLQDRGMEPIRHFYTMAIQLNTRPPEPQWPEDITVRPMQSLEEARAVVAAVRDAFRDHWGYVEQPFEQELEHWLHFMKHEESFDPSLWFLAMDGTEIAGVSLCTRRSREDENMGWVRTLGVRRPWRRQGLGLALLHHSFGEFYRIGQTRAGLGVDASSLTGATRLYERAGMRPIRQFDSYELVLRLGRDISTQEVAPQGAE